MAYFQIHNDILKDRLYCLMHCLKRNRAMLNFKCKKKSLGKKKLYRSHSKSAIWKTRLFFLAPYLVYSPKN